MDSLTTMCPRYTATAMEPSGSPPLQAESIGMPATGSKLFTYRPRPADFGYRERLKITLEHSGSEPTTRVSCGLQREEHRASQRMKGFATMDFKPSSKIALIIYGLAQPAESAVGTGRISRTTISKTDSPMVGSARCRKTATEIC